MVYYENYQTAWMVYIVLGILTYFLAVIAVKKLPWPSLRLGLYLGGAVVLFMPWIGGEPVRYSAPMILVGAFQFIDATNKTEVLTQTLLPLWVGLVGSVFIALVSAVIRKIRGGGSSISADETPEHQQQEQ